MEEEEALNWVLDSERTDRQRGECRVLGQGQQSRCVGAQSRGKVGARQPG